MNIMLLQKLALTPSPWPGISAAHAVRGRLLKLMAPFLLLPPLMAFGIAHRIVGTWIAGAGSGNALMHAVAVLLAELLMLWVVAEITQSAARMHDVYIGARESLLLAPLALAVPDVAFNVAALLLALCYASALFYHGVVALGRIREPLQAVHVAYVVASVSTLLVFLAIFVLALA